IRPIIAYRLVRSLTPSAPPPSRRPRRSGAPSRHGSGSPGTEAGGRSRACRSRTRSWYSGTSRLEGLRSRSVRPSSSRTPFSVTLDSRARLGRRRNVGGAGSSVRASVHAVSHPTAELVGRAGGQGVLGLGQVRPAERVEDGLHRPVGVAVASLAL